jgi:hypothetical protein
MASEGLDMRKAIAVSALTLLTCLSNTFADGGLQAEIDCEKALVNVSVQSPEIATIFYDLKDGKGTQGLVAVPVRKGTQHGLYVFTNNNAFYYPLKNDSSQKASFLEHKLFHADYDSYFMDLKIPSLSGYDWEIHGSYPPLTANQPTTLWSWDFAPQKGVDMVFDKLNKVMEVQHPDTITPKATDLLNDASRGVLHDALGKQIQLVHEAYDNARGRMSYAEGAKFDGAKYVSALESCKKVPEVKNLAISEIEKFPNSSSGSGATKPQSQAAPAN